MGQNQFIKYILLLFLITFLSFPVFAQKSIQLSGFVSDSATGERLSGASVYIPWSRNGTTCNEYGFFSFTIPISQTKVVFRFVGYDPLVVDVKALKDTVINVQLMTNNSIEEVKVTAMLGEGVLSSTLGMHKLSAKEVDKIPVILGEPDLLKGIQLLPGVSFSTEGFTGFSVRGGSPANTLIQLDGVPVYNVNHLWGFMSAFNNDAISESILYKGSLPAQFGGRLGSVLDVRMREGNLKKRTGTFSLSPISGRYTLEGPIVKDKASFMFSARKTWADVFMWGIQKLNSGDQLQSYGFWDINAKANWIVNHKNRIYLSFYTGRDAFVVKTETGKYNDYSMFSYNWQNLTGVLRWNHIFSSTLFVNFSAFNSRFRQEYLNKSDKHEQEGYRGYNNLNDLTFKGDFDWFPGTKSRIKFGYQFSIQEFSPEVITIKTDTSSLTLNNDIFTRNIISEVYFESEVDIFGNLKGNFGLRGGNMKAKTKNYWSLQPRISLSYLFNDKVSVKISYSRMNQYLHQLQNTTLGIPTELWVSSTDLIKPETSNLFSTGIYWRPGIKYNFSAEIYYNTLQNVIRYKDGTTTLKERGESWENYVVRGKGESYGLELMAKKTSGKVTGWIAYTLSKSTRQFDEINFGKAFPYAYDRRHQLNMNTNWFLKQKDKNGISIRKDLSATFSFASGKYATLAEQEYQAIPLPLMEGTLNNTDWFGTRNLMNSVNNYQMPDFHNISLSYRIARKRKDKIITWNFSVYNVYNRLNPWYYYKKNGRLYQFSIFPIIPSVSFTYKW